MGKLMKKLLIIVALGTSALTAVAQMQQPSGSQTPSLSTLQQLLRNVPPPTPEQQEASKAAIEALRVTYERMLAERFVVKGNEIYDKKADLTWQRCNYGQTWDEENKWCKGAAKRLTITQASAEASKEQKSWRVPEIGELVSLLEVACGNTKLKDATAPIFPEIASMTYYMSSSIREDPQFVDAGQCFGSSAQNAGLGKGYVSLIRLVKSGR